MYADMIYQSSEYKWLYNRHFGHNALMHALAYVCMILYSLSAPKPNTSLTSLNTLQHLRKTCFLNTLLKAALCQLGKECVFPFPSPCSLRVQRMQPLSWFISQRFWQENLCEPAAYISCLVPVSELAGRGYI